MSGETGRRTSRIGTPAYPFNVNLPVELREGLADSAAALHVTQSHFVRVAVHRLLAELAAGRASATDFAEVRAPGGVSATPPLHAARGEAV